MPNTLTKSIKTAISCGDVGKIKSQLIAMIKLDPSMKMFIKNYDEVIKYIDIAEEYCEQPNEYTLDEKDKWDISYFQYKVEMLKSNFSYQRIMDIANMYRVVYVEKQIAEDLEFYDECIQKEFDEKERKILKWISAITCIAVSSIVVICYKLGLLF